jgi:DNA-directed RNA polymerase III subunit RPC8
MTLKLPNSILTNNYSDKNYQQYVWKTEDGEVYYDKHEAVRFQIDDEHWHDQTPVGPSEAEDDVKKSPYTLTASMKSEGLGPCLWWDDTAVVQEE